MCAATYVFFDDRRFCTPDLDEGWKLFCSGIDPEKFAQDWVGYLKDFQLENCVD